MLKKTFLFFLFILTISVKAQDFPERATTLVSDYANALSSEERQLLEQKLVAFNDSTSTQIAVVIMKSTGNFDIADYAVQLFNKWHIGQESKNNGILVLVAKDDHHVFITTGFGLEGVLPDALCKRIVEQDILPRFKTGDFYGGLDEATNSIMSIVKGEYSAENYLKKKNKPIFFPFLMFFFIALIVLFSQFRRVSSYARTNNLAFWAAWALLNAATNRSRGSWGNFTGGGSWGGGGGGFGGFGGGSSGGGGAGGSW